MNSYPLVKFSKDNANNFFRTLNKRVNDYFKSNGIKKTGDYRLYIKTAVMLAIFILPYLSTLIFSLPIWALFIMYAVMGMGVAGIGLCIMHDSLHGSFSKKPALNKLFSLSMNLIGGSAFTWKVQHNFLHHTFTNVKHLDEDIDDKPFIRLSPTGKLKKYHRFQHVYAFFLYSLATVSWLLFKDFKQLVQYNKSGITEEHGKGSRQ